MKLYNCPRNSKVRIVGDAKIPPGAPTLKRGDIIDFSHIDGMYSYCRKEGTDIPVHLAAWTEVELIQ